jgi:predicted nuclease of predicted toxin-antitoxin system
VKLLLDEMWSPVIATQRRRRGHDVVAVTERPDLRRQSDAVIFAVAQREDRAVVTENVADFRQIAAFELRRGRAYVGLIFTRDRRFPRHDRRTAGRLVTALDELLAHGPAGMGFEWWLS